MSYRQTRSNLKRVECLIIDHIKNFHFMAQPLFDVKQGFRDFQKLSYSRNRCKVYVALLLLYICSASSGFSSDPSAERTRNQSSRIFLSPTSQIRAFGQLLL